MIEEYKKIFEKAYAYMDETVIDGNCGELCNYICCNPDCNDGEEMGIYFMPYEYESLHKDNPIFDKEKIEYHNSEDYCLTEKIDYLLYGYCNSTFNCNRELRPIQCRTYPLIPHIKNKKLQLIMEKQNCFDCPLPDMFDQWRKEYIEGIYKGWKELIKIKEIYDLVEFDSLEREYEGNVLRVIIE